MKKVLCFAAAAMTLFASCQKTEIVSNNNDGPQEISLFAINKTATKTPVDGTSFQTTDKMTVVAYLANGDGATAGNFFSATTFEGNPKEAGSSEYIWTGDPARYWPLSTSTINFLAVTENGGNVDGRTEISFDGTTPASAATVVLKNNDTYNQTDLMFAAAQGTHTQGADYTAVTMAFKHALTWICFTVSTPTDGPTVTVNSITLNNATYNGSLAIGNANYAGTSNTESLTTTWTPGNPTAKLKVPNATGDAAASPITLTNGAAAVTFGNGLLVIPNAYAGSFTINYTMTQDGGKNTFDYTYNLPPSNPWQIAQKYTYNISFKFTEIAVNPSVSPWTTTGGSSDVAIQK